MTCNNPNLDLVKLKAYAKFNQIPLIRSQDIEWTQNFDNNQGPKLCCISMEIEHNNPNLKVNSYANFGLIPSICSQDIEQKQWYAGGIEK